MNTQKSAHRIVCFLLVFCLFFCNCTVVSTYAAKSPALNQTNLTMYRYHTFQLKVKNTSRKIQWKTGNKNIASVNKKGVVTANAIGKTTIKAIIGKKTLSCKVTVNENLRQEEIAAYGYGAALKILKNNNLKLVDAKYSSYMDGTEFSYLTCTYTDKADKTRNVYISIYPNESESILQLNTNTALYGNLIVELSGSPMERMMEDRSTPLKVSKIKKIYSSLSSYEKPKTTIGSSFTDSHSWMDL